MKPPAPQTSIFWSGSRTLVDTGMGKDRPLTSRNKFDYLEAKPPNRWCVFRTYQIQKTPPERLSFPRQVVFIRDLIICNGEQVSGQISSAGKVTRFDNAVSSRQVIVDIWSAQVDRHRPSNQTVEHLFTDVVDGVGIFKCQVEQVTGDYVQLGLAA